MEHSEDSRDDLTKREKIKLHFKANKKVYIAAGGGVIVGAVGVFMATRGHVTIINETAPVFNNTPIFNNDNSSVVNFGGRLTKIVECLETGETWKKVTEAAEAANTSTSYMSRHLHGHKDDVHGLHYEIIGVRTTG